MSFIDKYRSYTWPITNRAKDENKASEVTMVLTETAHAAMIKRVGPNARFKQRSSRGVVAVSTGFGDSSNVLVNALFKDACALMFPELADKIKKDNVEVEHLLNSATGLNKKQKFINLATYDFKSIALYTDALNMAVGVGALTTSNATTGISRHRLQALFALNWLDGAKKTHYRPLKCLIELGRKHPNHAKAVMLEEVWTEFTRLRLEHYLSEKEMKRYRGSLHFSISDSGRVTLTEMSDAEIIDVLRKRFASPTPEQIAAQRARFVAERKKEIAERKKLKQIEGQSKLSFETSSASAPAPPPPPPSSEPATRRSSRARRQPMRLDPSPEEKESESESESEGESEDDGWIQTDLVEDHDFPEFKYTEREGPPPKKFKQTKLG